MLASPDVSKRTVVRPSQSLRLEYEEFKQERIEDHKNRIARVELMALADRAMRMIETRAENQLSLSEVLVSEQVDRLIAERLKIPRFSKWKNWFVKIRLAQRQATHWQRIAPDCPIIDVVLRLEADDSTLIVGAQCADHGYFVAAHDCNVTFVAEDVPSVDAFERRAASEALSSQFDSYAVDLSGNWFPPCDPCLVVIDPGVLFTLEADHQHAVVDRLKELTRPGGLHYFAATGSEESPERELQWRHLGGLYDTWLASSTAQTGEGFPTLFTRPV